MNPGCGAVSVSAPAVIPGCGAVSMTRCRLLRGCLLPPSGRPEKPSAGGRTATSGLLRSALPPAAPDRGLFFSQPAAVGSVRDDDATAASTEHASLAVLDG